MSANSDLAVAAIVKEFGADRSRLLAIVEQIQHRFGHISDATIQAIATGLGIHGVEIEDMVSFYAFFNREPRGRFQIRLSKTPISFMKGAEQVARAFEDALGCSLGGMSADGAFALDW